MSTLTVILQADQLCQEFPLVVNRLILIKPKYLVINSLNHDLIDYFIYHYPDHHLTCLPFDQNLNNLYRDVHSSYQSQRYLLLNGLDLEPTLYDITKILSHFDQVDCQKGYLIKPLRRNQLITKNNLSKHTINQINPNFLYLNTTDNPQPANRYHYLSSSFSFQTPNHPRPLLNRVVLITGALGGIGLVTSEYYYQMGYQVIGLDRHSPDQVKTILFQNGKQKKKKQDHISNPFSQYYQLDLSQARISEAIKDILSELPRLDQLIHVAGLQECHTIRHTHSTGKDWDRIFNVNLRSVYTLTRQCFPLLRTTLGSVVVVSSVHAFASSEEISLYAISKTALTGLVRNFAIEWGKYGIRVNGVAPGAIDTTMLKAGLSRHNNHPNQAFRRLAERHLRGKIGQPSEIATTIYFLGDSNQSGFITGQTLIADGGAALTLSTEVSR